MSTGIEKVWAREILDSRGNPTVEVDVGWNSAASAGRRFPPGLQPGSTKPWNSATEKKKIWRERGP